LNVIHIAGTKGKGSTCAFVRSLLRAHGLRTGYPAKIGLYTSPDLRCIRERIQLDDQPITKDAFAKYFFEVWDGVSSRNPETTEDSKKLPRYLQLLALLALHSFIREKTEVVILETHHGGEYDATNVVQKPAVTGITPIGMDHVAQLGPTLESIAWHKAGIFKHGAPAFSAPQDPQTAAVLQTRAVEKSVELTFVPVDTTLSTNTQSLNVTVQKMNCSLAIAISNAFLKRTTTGRQHVLSQAVIAEGTENFSWPGRFETIQEGQCSWFLDGAHNELSVKQAAMWFAEVTPKRRYADSPSRFHLTANYSINNPGFPSSSSATSRKSETESSC
jgi:folylpolyglutamate synthase